MRISASLLNTLIGRTPVTDIELADILRAIRKIETKGKHAFESEAATDGGAA